ncbi:MAG TPA: hypothetical protein PLU72_13770 [Candidatus Ozemobacteraceae bacterium]|nr:hypothetical protein [Candidatus Ozemobacteraceae bacterium]HQG28929.1 hypothetical protein [Candidatus Ozemobacteraceae bacterium]
MAAPPSKSLLREIVGRLRNRNFRSGLEMFKTLFGPDRPPTGDSLGQILDELNPQEFPEQAFEVMSLACSWVPDDKDFTTVFENIRKTYYDKLVTKASLAFQNAKQKAKSFAERSQAVDSIARIRLEEENKRTIEEMLEACRMDFEKAVSLLPDSIAAYYGLLRFYKQMENEEKTAELRQIVRKIETTGRLHDIVEKETFSLPPMEPIEMPSTPQLSPEQELQHIEAIYNDRDFDSALTAVERLLIQEPSLLPALQLKIRILVAKRQFHPAKATLKHAFEVDPVNETTRKIQVDFLETKLKTLSRIADVFITKALRLGPSLGREYFRKACKLLEQAVVIAPDELSLLDQLYTCYMYLEDEQRAAIVRRDIALINPNYVTTIARLRKSSLCFLAGYAYDEAPESLEPFRRVRRNLLRTLAGRLLVTWYIRLSPVLVDTARRFHIPKALFRVLLFPLLETARRLARTP